MPRAIIEAIASQKFLATEAQVEHLAGIAVAGQRASGTYLAVLVAHVQQSFIGRTRKPANDAVLAVIDTTHDHFYAHVCKGVGPEDMEQNERNRRATFARSAASDLRYFAANGGDIRKIDPATITKNQLRKVGRSVPTGTRVERAFSKSFDMLARTAQRIARKDQKNAAKRLRDSISDLEELLEQVEAGEFELKDKARKPAKRIESKRVERRRTPTAPENRTH